MTQYLNIALPIALVFIAFLLKLFVDQCATVPLIIRSIYEVPINVVFLALSFTTAFTIALPTNIHIGMLHIYVFFAVSLLVVVLWRRSIVLFEREELFWSAVLFVLNGVISGFALFESVALIIPKVTT
jgi:hypothetical protein